MILYYECWAHRSENGLKHEQIKEIKIKEYEI